MRNHGARLILDSHPTPVAGRGELEIHQHLDEMYGPGYERSFTRTIPHVAAAGVLTILRRVKIRADPVGESAWSVEGALAMSEYPDLTLQPGRPLRSGTRGRFEFDDGPDCVISADVTILASEREEVRVLVRGIRLIGILTLERVRFEAIPDHGVCMMLVEPEDDEEEAR